MFSCFFNATLSRSQSQPIAQALQQERLRLEESNAFAVRKCGDQLRDFEELTATLDRVLHFIETNTPQLHCIHSSLRPSTQRDIQQVLALSRERLNEVPIPRLEEITRRTHYIARQFHCADVAGGLLVV